MKKFLAVFLGVVVIICAFAGCSFNQSGVETTSNTTTQIIETTSETTTESTTVQEYTNDETDWRSFVVVVNGEKIQLPISYEEFSKKTGYTLFEETLNEDDAFNYLDPTLTREKSLLLADGGVEYEENLTGHFYNPTNERIHYKDALIIGFEVSSVWYECPNIVFPGNLKYGQKISQNEIEKMFGEPYNIYTYSLGYQYEYGERSSESDGLNYSRYLIHIDGHTGEIDEMSLYCYDF